MSNLRKVVVGLVFVGSASEAFAQGCAMCLVSAMSQGVRAMEAFNLGILVLLIPSFLMIVGILIFAFLRRS